MAEISRAEQEAAAINERKQRIRRELNGNF